MSARVVSLRALLVEDIARTAEKACRPAAAYLLRRLPDDPAAVTAAGEELRHAVTGTARGSGRAAGWLAVGEELRAAVQLAGDCGLSVPEWVDATVEEQGVELDARGMRTVREIEQWATEQGVELSGAVS